VLGLGDSLGDSQPSAQLEVNYDTSANNITIEHAGGDRLESDSLNVIVSAEDGSASSEGTISSALAVGDSVEGSVANGSSPATTPNVRVRVIHQPSDSILLDRTQELSNNFEIEDEGGISF
jgi:hypothetical protein